MKLSREKILRLSHLILDHLNKDEEIEYYADPQEIRQEIVKMISDNLDTRVEFVTPEYRYKTAFKIAWREKS